ncbi:MAG TPA: hypothetical protein VF525_12625 [Pyrinomonadaceae bacterium]|jgi:hypothetical protein
MLLDWQNVAVLLLVLGALAYVGRRGWARLRSLGGRGMDAAGCATGCGSCGPAERTPQMQPKVLVQIGRPGTQAKR